MREVCLHCENERLLSSETCMEHIDDSLAWKERVLQIIRAEGLDGGNLAGIDLSGEDLRDCRLELVNMNEAQLQNTLFTGADLSRSSLVGATATGANFDGARMQAVNARRIQAAGASMKGTRLNGAVLAGADLSNCDFSGSELADVNLRKARVVEANFSRAQLHRTSFSGADVTDSDFSDALFRETVMIEVQGLDGAITEGIITSSESSGGDDRIRPSDLAWKHWSKAGESPWEFGRIPPEEEKDE